MASLQNIKKRLSGIKNISQMTSAMELVAATKMRRAQETALASRPYALTALEVLANLAESVSAHYDELAASFSPLLATRPVRTIAVLVVTADKGLAGSFNSSVFKKIDGFLTELPPAEKEHVQFIALGQKAVDYLKRKKINPVASFIHYGDVIHLAEAEPLTALLQTGYETGRFDRVVAFSTAFFSTLHQEVLLRQLLPLNVDKIRATVAELIPEHGRFAKLRANLLESRPARPVEYIIEPSPAAALAHLLPLLFKMQIYHIILEANASEHSARRTAMKNATDNAAELIADLTLTFNRSRQAAITKEITEITGTVAAME